VEAAEELKAKNRKRKQAAKSKRDAKQSKKSANKQSKKKNSSKKPSGKKACQKKKSGGKAELSESTSEGELEDSLPDQCMRSEDYSSDDSEDDLEFVHESFENPINWLGPKDKVAPKPLVVGAGLDISLAAESVGLPQRHGRAMRTRPPTAAGMYTKEKVGNAGQNFKPAPAQPKRKPTY
jgi:hypothetical protein